MISVTNKYYIYHYLFTELPVGFEVSTMENENVPEYREEMNGVRVFCCYGLG